MRYETVTVGFDGPIDNETVTTAAAIAREHRARLVVAVAYDRGSTSTTFRDALGGDAHAVDPTSDSEHQVHDLATRLRTKYGLDVVERFTPRSEMFDRLIRDADDHTLVIVPNHQRGFSAGRSLGKLRKRDNVLVISEQREPTATH